MFSFVLASPNLSFRGEIERDIDFIHFLVIYVFLVWFSFCRFINDQQGFAPQHCPPFFEESWDTNGAYEVQVFVNDVKSFSSPTLSSVGVFIFSWFLSMLTAVKCWQNIDVCFQVDRIKTSFTRFIIGFQ